MATSERTIGVILIATVAAVLLWGFYGRKKKAVVSDDGKLPENLEEARSSEAYKKTMEALNRSYPEKAEYYRQFPKKIILTQDDKFLPTAPAIRPGFFPQQPNYNAGTMSQFIPMIFFQWKELELKNSAPVKSGSNATGAIMSKYGIPPAPYKQMSVNPAELALRDKFEATGYKLKGVITAGNKCEAGIGITRELTGKILNQACTQQYSPYSYVIFER